MSFRCEFTTRRIVTGDKKIMSLALTPMIADSLYPLLLASRRKHNDYLRILVRLPYQGRSTGPESQGNAINGAFAQIYKQSGFQGDFETFRLWMKSRLIPYWPYDTMPDGSLFPRSETTLSMEQASEVIEALIIIAAEWGYTLEGFDHAN